MHEEMIFEYRSNFAIFFLRLLRPIFQVYTYPIFLMTPKPNIRVAQPKKVLEDFALRIRRGSALRPLFEEGACRGRIFDLRREARLHF